MLWFAIEWSAGAGALGLPEDDGARRLPLAISVLAACVCVCLCAVWFHRWHVVHPNGEKKKNAAARRCAVKYYEIILALARQLDVLFMNWWQIFGFALCSRTSIIERTEQKKKNIEEFCCACRLSNIKFRLNSRVSSTMWFHQHLPRAHTHSPTYSPMLPMINYDYSRRYEINCIHFMMNNGTCVTRKIVENVCACECVWVGAVGHVNKKPEQQRQHPVTTTKMWHLPQCVRSI